MTHVSYFTTHIGYMTLTQRLQILCSEQRSRLAELPAGRTHARAPAELGTLGTTHQDTEAQLRGASRRTATRRKRRSHGRPRGGASGWNCARTSFGRYLVAALTGQQITGAESEYQAACKTPGIPIDLFEQDRPEIRADAASGVPATGAGATLAPIQPFVFSQSIAPLLGVEMPSVGSGAYSEMTISTALTAAAKAKGTGARVHGRGAHANDRESAIDSRRLTLNLEDIAAIGQTNFESALRQNAQAVVSDALDTQVIAGNGAAPNLNGLINQLTDPANPAAVAKFDAFVEAFADSIDGLWAPTMMDLGMGVNVDAYKLAAKSYRDRVIDTGNRGGVSWATKPPRITSGAYTGGFWTNKRMPATDATIARGIVYRKGRMGLRTACLPTWGSIAVDDIYSDAASGQRHFTLNILVGSKVLLVQPDAYSLVEFKVS